MRRKYFQKPNLKKLYVAALVERRKQYKPRFVIPELPKEFPGMITVVKGFYELLTQYSH